jgi:hypothetical protein
MEKVCRGSGGRTRSAGRQQQSATLLRQPDPTHNESPAPDRNRFGPRFSRDRGGEKRKNVMPKPQTSRPEIGCSICCTNCCTEGAQEHPKTPKNACMPPTLHNNIRKTESFRNRQVSGSTPLVGSRFHAGSEHSTTRNPFSYPTALSHLCLSCRLSPTKVRRSPFAAQLGFLRDCPAHHSQLRARIGCRSKTIIRLNSRNMGTHQR